MIAMPNPVPASLPLFPLTTHVLPGGRLPLRIFEARYLRMVKEACRSGQGFAMCMLNPRATGTLRNMYAIATWVKVVDFASLADGLLGITIEGLRCVRIEQLWQEPDGLRYGQISDCPAWPQQPLTATERPMQQQLARLYAEHEQLGRLYPAALPEDAAWLCQRWLELLPLAAADKQYLLAQPDCSPTLALLQQLLCAERPALAQ